MFRLALGLLAGLLHRALSAASMVPLQFPDKRAALLGGQAPYGSRSAPPR